MATLAVDRTSARSPKLLVPLLGIAVFLNYIDRGVMGIAAPVMTRDLHLSPFAYGLAFSAFYWFYAPVQLFAGRLCDRFSVYSLMVAGVVLWAGSTLLTGLATGAISLLLLRIALGVGESISFPGSTKIIARHVPAEGRGTANAMVATGLALGPTVGTLAGGLILALLGWRWIFLVFGTITLLWVMPWRATVSGLYPRPVDEREGPVPLSALLGKWSLWSLSIIHCLGNYSFYFLLAWLPTFLIKSRGFSVTQMTVVVTIGYAVQAVCALSLGRFSDWWTRSGRPEGQCRRWMMIVSQAAAAVAVLGVASAHSLLAIALILCLAGAATASLSVNIYAIGQIFSGPRAAGTWMGFQNAIGNVSGIVGPIITGIIVQRAGYDMAFYVTAAVAALGAIWFLVAVPPIKQVQLD